MNEDDLKRYTVQVGSGSGCLFQPLSDDHTYILTSRHLFCDQQTVDGITIFVERADKQKARIKYYVYNGTEWKTREFELTVTQGENYFSHPNSQVDAVILKIPHIENCDRITIYRDHKTPAGFSLCGHPSNRRNQGDPYTSYLIQSSIASTNFGQTAQLSMGNVTQDHIEGMSGGGILRPDRSAILIAGVQSKMLSVILPAGQVAFVPIKYYDEVVESSDSKLKELVSQTTPTDLAPLIGNFDRLKTVVRGNRTFSAFCILLFLCAFLASLVFCMLSSDSQTNLGIAIATITFILSMMSFLQFRGYQAKIIAHDMYVNQYKHGPPPPHYETEDKIIANAKISLL